jgi:hypothetical protein
MKAGQGSWHASIHQGSISRDKCHLSAYPPTNLPSSFYLDSDEFTICEPHLQPSQTGHCFPFLQIDIMDQQGQNPTVLDRGL